MSDVGFNNTSSRSGEGDLTGSGGGGISTSLSVVVCCCVSTLFF